jgi:uncharacterized protein
MPTRLDVAFAVACATVLIAQEVLYMNRRLKRQIAAGGPSVRRKAYWYVIVAEWVLTAIALLLWGRAQLPWSTLGLVMPRDWRLVPAILVPALLLASTIHQSRAVQRLGVKQRAALRGRLADAEFFMPHTPDEHRWFLLLALTAGFCEQLLYRGFLTWLVAAYVDLPAAIGVAAVAFGLAHASQGPRGVIKTALFGVLMSLVVVLTGSLVPAMIVHALVDIGAGDMGFAVFADRPALMSESQPLAAHE